MRDSDLQLETSIETLWIPKRPNLTLGAAGVKFDISASLVFTVYLL